MEAIVSGKKVARKMLVVLLASFMAISFFSTLMTPTQAAFMRTSTATVRLISPVSLFPGITIIPQRTSIKYFSDDKVDTGIEVLNGKELIDLGIQIYTEPALINKVAELYAWNQWIEDSGELTLHGLQPNTQYYAKITNFYIRHYSDNPAAAHIVIPFKTLP